MEIYGKVRNPFEYGEKNSLAVIQATIKQLNTKLTAISKLDVKKVITGETDEKWNRIASLLQTVNNELKNLGIK